MKIYLSGPMSGIEEYNFPLFMSEAKRLRAAGYIIENPAENETSACMEWIDFMRIDIKQLVDCEAIAMLPNWYNSRGANLEYTIARALGLIVYDASELK